MIQQEILLPSTQIWQISVIMDNTPPKVTSVALSTNNSGTLFNDLTGQARPNDLVAFYQDNITLKFETSERVRIQPKVKINGDMKLATAQVIDNITDTSGTKCRQFIK